MLKEKNGSRGLKRQGLKDGTPKSKLDKKEGGLMEEKNLQKKRLKDKVYVWVDSVKRGQGGGICKKGMNRDAIGKNS